MVSSHVEVVFVCLSTDVGQPFCSDWEPVLPPVKAIKSGPVVSPRQRW